MGFILIGFIVDMLINFDWNVGAICCWRIDWWVLLRRHRIVMPDRPAVQIRIFSSSLLPDSYVIQKSRQFYHSNNRESLKITSWKIWGRFFQSNFCSLISVNEMHTFVSFPHFKLFFLWQSCLHHLSETQSPESKFPFPKKFENTWQQIQVFSAPSSSLSSSPSSWRSWSNFSEHK